MSNSELERRVQPNHSDVDAIYDMLSVISATPIHHGRNLSNVEARVAELDTRLTARLDGIDTRHEARRPVREPRRQRRRDPASTCVLTAC